MPLPLQSTFLHNSVEVINRSGDRCISASILILRARKLLVISEHRNTGELQSLTVARWAGQESLSNKAAREPLLAQQETMSVAAAVSVASHDVASRVDLIRVGENGSRHVDRGKCTIAQ